MTFVVCVPNLKQHRCVLALQGDGAARSEDQQHQMDAFSILIVAARHSTTPRGSPGLSAGCP